MAHHNQPPEHTLLASLAEVDVYGELTVMPAPSQHPLLTEKPAGQLGFRAYLEIYNYPSSIRGPSLYHKVSRRCEPLVTYLAKRKLWEAQNKGRGSSPLYVTLKCPPLLHTVPARDSPLPSNTPVSAHMYPPLVNWNQV